MISEHKMTCAKFPDCSASLCPEMNTADGIWYPDEDVCMRRCYASLKWIRKQKKIAKKTIYRDFYFSKNDIEQIKRITTKTKGRNPDKDITQCPTQNYPEFNEKTIANRGICAAATPSTYQTLTDNPQQIKPPFNRVFVKILK